MTDIELKDKLSKLHALYAGAQTEGERASAIKAKARLLKNIENKAIYKFSLQNEVNAKIFIDLLQRYEIYEFKKTPESNNTILAKVPGYFVDQILWPEYISNPQRQVVFS